MTWLAILLVLLLQRAGVDLSRWQSDDWFWAYRRQVASVLRRWGLRTQLQWPLVVIPPVVLLAAVGYWLSGKWLGVPYFLLVVGTLVYSQGRGRLRQQVDQYLDFWRSDEVLEAGQSARAFATDAQRLSPKALAPLHRFAVDGMLYRSFSEWFGVVFWLALLGPWAALCYRLLHLYLLSDASVRSQNDAVRGLLYTIDWVPARVLGFVFALVGNFIYCYPVWQEQLRVQGRSAPIFLRCCSVAALADGETLACQGVQEGQGGTRRVEELVRGAEQIRALMALLRRANVVWWLLILLIDTVL